MIFRHFVLLSLCLLCGCGRSPVRMDQPENPHGRYAAQIAAAARLLAQRETWADRVEWEVVPVGEGWRVIAWRIEHPERKGAERYSPRGYSVIELDSRLVTVSYRPKG